MFRRLNKIRNFLKNVKNFFASVFKLTFTKNSFFCTTSTLALAPISSVIKLVLPIAVVYIIPEITKSAQFSTGNIIVISIAFSISWIVGQLEPEIKRVIISQSSSEFAHQLGNKILKKFFELSLDANLSTPTGAVSKHITSSFTIAHKLVPALYAEIIPNTLELFIIIPLISVTNGYLGIGFVGTLALYYVVAIGGSKFKERAQKNYLDEAYKTYGVLLTTVENYENAHYFNKVPYELKNYSDVSRLLKKALLKSNLVTNFTALTQRLIVTGSFISMMGYTGYTMFLSGGYADYYQLVKFLLSSFYLFQALTPLNTLSQSISDFNETTAELKNMLNFMSQKSEIVEHPNAKKLVATKENSAIQFKNVTFGYEEGNILDDVTFTIESGKKTAIVGLSGAGKSTILRLMFRYYNPRKGMISINGQDIQYVTLVSLRKKIAVVPQQTVLFNQSLLKNITYADFNASKKEVGFVIDKAGLSEYVSGLQNGLDTVIGAHGGKISGGERQRIGLARAFLKRAPIIVFDEPTSSLDVKTESQVLQNLNDMYEGYTELVITHKLHTIIDSYNIIVLNRGKIVEQGNYKKLMQNRGYFCELMNHYLQTSHTLKGNVRKSVGKTSEKIMIVDSQDDVNRHFAIPSSKRGKKVSKTSGKKKDEERQPLIEKGEDNVGPYGSMNFDL